ncbi:MAG: type II secretion system protein [Chthoniobacteraceae bacterium]
MKKSSSQAFTLVELLTVMVIILILAGIVMSTVGYAQKKAAKSRALSEINAMSSACESYKTDNGGYPRNVSTDKLDPNNASYSSAAAPATSGTSLTPNAYSKASMWLYACLSGDYNGDGMVNTSDGDAMYAALGQTTKPGTITPTKYMDFKDDMRGRYSSTTDPTAGTDSYTFDPSAGADVAKGNAICYISDPFNNVFGYSTIKNSVIAADNAAGTTLATGSKITQGNNPSFDLWSTCGSTTSGTTTAQQTWVKNW